eukprot:TRINITY_DN29472_c0_g1_i1.p1 TRINITY_DN29472_c0_g1~~TRINITY_DN29472_c0_g1_i1.p1  ORF type:complete len:250 (+),score=2.00 TRINITY_DN29472_c0_g1_i1:70-819(+)
MIHRPCGPSLRVGNMCVCVCARLCIACVCLRICFCYRIRSRGQRIDAHANGQRKLISTQTSEKQCGAFRDSEFRWDLNEHDILHSERRFFYLNASLKFTQSSNDKASLFGDNSKAIIVNTRDLNAAMPKCLSSDTVRNSGNIPYTVEDLTFQPISDGKANCVVFEVSEHYDYYKVRTKKYKDLSLDARGSWGDGQRAVLTNNYNQGERFYKDFWASAKWTLQLPNGESSDEIQIVACNDQVSREGVSAQ